MCPLYGGWVISCAMPKGADLDYSHVVSAYGKNLEVDTKKYNVAKCSSMNVNRDICSHLLIPANIFLSVSHHWPCILRGAICFSSPMFMRMKALMQHYWNLRKFYRWLPWEWNQHQNTHGGFSSLNSLFVTDPMRMGQNYETGCFFKGTLNFCCFVFVGVFFSISNLAVGSNGVIIQVFLAQIVMNAKL